MEWGEEQREKIYVTVPGKTDIISDFEILVSR